MRTRDKAKLDGIRAEKFSRSIFADSEQMVWLVWEAVNGRAQLGVICTSDEDLARYVTPDRKTRLGSGTPVFCEKVMTNHWYGTNDMAIAMRIMRRS